MYRPFILFSLTTICGMVFFAFFIPQRLFAATLFTTGFESGTTETWVSSGGGATATVSADMKRSGTYSLQLNHDKTASYGFQQTVTNIEPGMFYTAGGYGKSTNPNTASFFIRVAWYASTDGSGSQLSSPNDSNVESTINGDWILLTTGTVQSSSSANSAKVRLVLTAKAAGSAASAFFDDIEFIESIAPTATPSNTPTPTPASAPTATRTPTPASAPTSTPTSTPKPSPTSTKNAASESAKDDILGAASESAFLFFGTSTPSPSKSEVKVLGKSKNMFPVVWMMVGGVCILFCGILLYYRIKRSL